MHRHHDQSSPTVSLCISNPAPSVSKKLTDLGLMIITTIWEVSSEVLVHGSHRRDTGTVYSEATLTFFIWK
jgi:hypothetical protein